MSASEADPRWRERHQHECEGRREGGWMIYTCPQCDYELRKNPASGELIVRNLKPAIRHFGSMPPPGGPHRLN